MFQKLLTHSLTKVFSMISVTLYNNLNIAATKVIRLGRKKGNNEQPQHKPLLVALENESTLLARSGQLRCHDKSILHLIKPNLKELSTKSWLMN